MSVVSTPVLKGYEMKKSKWTSFLLSPYLYLPILALGIGVHYSGGVNEFVISVMSYSYYYYGFLHGGETVFADTNYGKLKGFTFPSREGNEFYQFLGIPYASPPVGRLRFEVR